MSAALDDLRRLDAAPRPDAALDRRQAIEQDFRREQQAQRRRGRQRQLLLGVAGVIAFLLAWEIAPRVVPGVNPKMFPPPSQVAGVLVDMTFRTGEIWPHVGASLLRALWGFLLGATFGVAAGVLTGRNATLRQITDPVLHGLRAIPAIAIVPLAIVWFGLGDLSKVMLIAWGRSFRSGSTPSSACATFRWSTCARPRRWVRARSRPWCRWRCPPRCPSCSRA